MNQFDPVDYEHTRKFGDIFFSIRLGRPADRAIVWRAYSTAAADFFKFITVISHAMVNRWYPQDGVIDLERIIPFNVIHLEINGDKDNVNEKELAFAGNVTLGLGPRGHNQGTASVGLGVLPKYQGLGIGQHLTELAVRLGRDHPHIVRLELHVVASNKKAIHIYKKFGFETEGRLKNRWRYPDGTYDDELIMAILFPGKMP